MFAFCAIDSDDIFLGPFLGPISPRDLTEVRSRKYAFRVFLQRVTGLRVEDVFKGQVFCTRDSRLPKKCTRPGYVNS